MPPLNRKTVRPTLYRDTTIPGKNPAIKDTTTKDKPASMEEAKVFFAKLKDNLRRDKKTDNFMPFVIIRSCAGDNGTRPLPANSPPFWESPDIWTWAGDPGSAPKVPPNQGGEVSVGGTYTVYAHAWNLGLAPVAGARLEWYWFHPFLGIDSSHANLIGVERVDLAPRGFPGCHKLVKCPQAYVVQPLMNDHPCLVARISAFGDPLSSTNEWYPPDDRHVAQKNLTVVDVMEDVQNVLRSLDATRRPGTLVRLFQVGQEAAQAVTLASPQLKIDPAVKTALLAELSPEGNLTVPPLNKEIPRVMPHLLINLGNKPAVPSIRARKVANTVQPILLHEKADVTMLLHHANLMSPELANQFQTLALPKKGQAQVLRIISYQDDHVAGGYTIIVKGK